MGLVFFKIKREENRRYNYTPRFYKGKESENPLEISQRMNRYRDTPNAIDFGAQWKVDRKMYRTRKNRGINKRFIIIFLILVFIFLWIIDFDLSIFTIPHDPLGLEN